MSIAPLTNNALEGATREYIPGGSTKDEKTEASARPEIKKPLSALLDTRRIVRAKMTLLLRDGILEGALPDGDVETISGEELHRTISEQLEGDAKFKEPIRTSNHSVHEIAEHITRRIYGNTDYPIGFEHNNVRYLTHGFLGEGGMGAVFRAFSDANNEPLVIKMPKQSSMNTHVLERFTTEAEALSKLTEECAPEHVAYSTGHPHFLAMKEIPNSATLYDVINAAGSGRLSSEFKLDVAISLSYALAKMHTIMIHRDIKPENILLSQKGAVFLDFGLARLKNVSADETRNTFTGQGLGTAKFAPLWQVLDAKNTDEKADIAAFGPTLYSLFEQDDLFTEKRGRLEDVHLLRLGKLAQKFPDVAVLIFRLVQDNPSLLPDAKYVCETLLTIKYGKRLSLEQYKREENPLFFGEKIVHGSPLAEQIANLVRTKEDDPALLREDADQDPRASLFEAVRDVYPDFAIHEGESLAKAFTRYIQALQGDVVDNSFVRSVVDRKNRDESIKRLQHAQKITIAGVVGTAAIIAVGLTSYFSGIFHSSKKEELNGKVPVATSTDSAKLSENSAPVLNKNNEESNVPSVPEVTPEMKRFVSLEYGEDGALKKLSFDPDAKAPSMPVETDSIAHQTFTAKGVPLVDSLTLDPLQVMQMLHIKCDPQSVPPTFKKERLLFVLTPNHGKDGDKRQIFPMVVIIPNIGSLLLENENESTLFGQIDTQVKEMNGKIIFTDSKKGIMLELNGGIKAGGSVEEFREHSLVRNFVQNFPYEDLDGAENGKIQLSTVKMLLKILDPIRASLKQEL
ncbi:hypothetical protein A2706_02030 [Candidatus Peribacteria bacterium RIFCSPHIGHO2_01_FULL_51_35]|nr:MAG: hypothetical protein A2706_02030 [Candidatus Peribacteria bacterium RIFCSPHIGHO2_01_FULL_51_35]